MQNAFPHQEMDEPLKIPRQSSIAVNQGINYQDHLSGMNSHIFQTESQFSQSP
jgi:hypothetical protein